MTWKNGMLFLAAAVIVAGGVVLSNRDSAQGQGKGGMGASHYSVVSTDGAHIIVTDNMTSKVHFYAIDKDGKVGDTLKLRGTLDLHDVGKPSMTPIDAKPQK